MQAVQRSGGVGTNRRPTKQRAYQITRQKGVPAPLVVLAQSAVWRRSAVEKWIKANRPDLVDDE